MLLAGYSFHVVGRAGAKERRRRAGPLQSFAGGRQKNFRSHPSRSGTVDKV